MVAKMGRIVVGLVVLLAILHGSHAAGSDFGDYVCTESMKHSFESMFIHTEDLTQMAQDSARMCELCVSTARLSFLYRNDERYEKEWAKIAHDHACHFAQKEAQGDCIRIAEGFISAQADFIKSKAAVIPPQERNSTTALAYAAEYRANEICRKVHCCPDRGLTPPPLGGKGGKSSSDGDSQPKETEKPKGTSAPSNATNTSHLSQFNQDKDFANGNMAPAQQAQLSLEAQQEKIELDRQSVEKDRKIVQKMKEGIMLARFVLAHKAQELLSKEAKVDAAIKNGSMICSNQELKQAPVRYANNSGAPLPHNGTNSSEPGAAQAGGSAPAASGSPAASGVSGASSSGSEVSPASVTPVKFRERMRIRDKILARAGGVAASYVFPNGMEAEPTDVAQQAPAPPAGYTWRYHYVEDNQ